MKKISQWLNFLVRRNPHACVAGEILFCELERRRVLSVNATLLSGILSIDIEPGLDPSIDSAALLAGSDSNTFLVDTNGNGVSDGGELTGAIADIQRLVVDGQNGFGRFAWYGDFSAANFDDTPLASINIRGLDQVVIGAEVETLGFISIRNISGEVQLGGDSSYAGQDYVGSMQIGRSLNVVGNALLYTGPNSSILISEDAFLTSDGEITLGSGVGDIFKVGGHAEIYGGTAASLQKVQVGTDGAAIGLGPQVDLNRVSIFASEARIFDINGIELDQVHVDRLTIHAGGAVTDRILADIAVRDTSSFRADSVNLSEGQFNSGTLEFRAVGNVVIAEDSSMNLLGTIEAENIDLKAEGCINDESLATVTVRSNASFNATEFIRLADSESNSLDVAGHTQLHAGNDITRQTIKLGLDGTQVGSATRVALSQVSLFGSLATVYEVDGLELLHVDADGLTLVTGGHIGDATTSYILVDGPSSFDASSVSLGKGTFNAGTVEFRANLDVTIHEDSGVNLAGVNRARDIEIRANGDVVDSGSSSITATANLLVIAEGNIELSNHSGSISSIAGNASFQASEDITLGLSPGAANFGSISLHGRQIHTRETSSVDLSAGVLGTGFSVIADQLRLEAPNMITQDAPISVSGSSEFRLLQSGDIMVARSISNGALMNNQFSGPISFSSDTGALGDVEIRDVSIGTTRVLGAASGDLDVEPQLDSLEVLLTNRSLEIAATSLDIGGDLQVVVGKDGDGSFDHLVTPNRTIDDAPGADLTVGGMVTLRSSGNVKLADQVGDRLRIAGETLVVAGFAQPSGFVGSEVGIGSAAGSATVLGNVSIIAERLVLSENDAVVVRVLDVGSVAIVAEGSVSDVQGASLEIREDATVRSLGPIKLADSGTVDTLFVGGTLSAIAIANILPNGDLALADIQLGSGITGAATIRSTILSDVRLGYVDLIGSQIDLIEIDGTHLTRAVAAENVDSRLNPVTAGGSLQVVSGGAIMNQDLNGTTAAGPVFAETARLDAHHWIMLEQSELGQLEFVVGANYQVSPSEAAYLRSLRNSEAIDTSLDLFGNIEQAFTRKSPSEVSLNSDRPSTLSEIAARYSFEATHGGVYALQIRNVGSLSISDGTAVGDDLNLYIETLAAENMGSDIVVTGPILFATEALGTISTKGMGGAVFIAGDSLKFENGGGILSSSYEVYHPELNANAFHGGEGVGGRLSTSRILPPEAAQLDPSTQHYQQQVAAVFGNRSAAGEDLGFQHVVAYADGSYQFFDVRNSTEPLQADLLIRALPFETNFLTAWGAEQLPTSVVFRRAEGLFLYQAGGTSDLAVQSFSATASSGFVNDVFVGTADPPLPPISQPAPPPELPFVASNPMIPEAPVTAMEISTVLEVRALTESVSEIVIVAIYWDDVDQTPANERLEREEFEDLEIRAASTGSADFLAERKREIVQLPNDRKLPVNATDEQIEGLIDDIQRNPLEYVDEEGRPLFTEPVYGIIQSDPERGETLWRLFMIRTDQLDGSTMEIMEVPDAARRNAETNLIIPSAEDTNRVIDESGSKSQTTVEEGSDTNDLRDGGEASNNSGQTLPEGTENVGSILITPVVYSAIKRMHIKFDRGSRAARKNSTFK